MRFAKRWLSAMARGCVALLALASAVNAAPLGQFEDHADIGVPKLAGAAAYNARLAGIPPHRVRREHVGHAR